MSSRNFVSGVRVGMHSRTLTMIRFILQPAKIVKLNGMISRWVIPFAANYPLNAYRLYIADGVMDVIQPENYVFRRYPHNQA